MQSRRVRPRVTRRAQRRRRAGSDTESSSLKGAQTLDGVPDLQPSDHKKCLGLLMFRPPLCLGIAGGYRELFAVTYKADAFRLSDSGVELPPRD